MKESGLNSVVLQKLSDFERLEHISPSAEWNDSLMTRISHVRTVPPSGISLSKYTIVLVFIILVNLGFILNSLIKNTNRSFNRTSEMNIISKELMVNPASINI